MLSRKDCNVDAGGIDSPKGLNSGSILNALRTGYWRKAHLIVPSGWVRIDWEAGQPPAESPLTHTRVKSGVMVRLCSRVMLDK